MNKRSVERVFEPPRRRWVGDGFYVHNFIPGVPPLTMARTNPFILLDYNSPHEFAPSDVPRGVGPHPHRGFETVTIAYQGKVEHHDSNGGGGVIGEGDVQWMTAAGGILHKEFHEKEWAKKGGVFQMVQLWVNLPKEYKMGTPRYQAIENKNFKAVSIDDDGSKVEIIAGEYKGVEGTALTFSPIHLWNVIMKKGASVKIDLPKDFNTLLLALKGSAMINDAEEVPVNNLALMANDGDYFELKAIEDCVILLMSGEPFDEPIAAYGPFVMNTREEIYQAFEDFNEGKFGYLE